MFSGELKLSTRDQCVSRLYSSSHYVQLAHRLTVNTMAWESYGQWHCRCSGVNRDHQGPVGTISDHIINSLPTYQRDVIQLELLSTKSAKIGVDMLFSSYQLSMVICLIRTSHPAIRIYSRTARPVTSTKNPAGQSLVPFLRILWYSHTTSLRCCCIRLNHNALSLAQIQTTVDGRNPAFWMVETLSIMG